MDPKFILAEHAGKAVGDRAVVCVLEQNYDATQTIPGPKAEQAALSAYGELEDRMVALADWLRNGLPAVLEEYQRSGRILGKDTDDLEGFDWLLDGRHYGPGERGRGVACWLAWNAGGNGVTSNARGVPRTEASGTQVAVAGAARPGAGQHDTRQGDGATG